MRRYGREAGVIRLHLWRVAALALLLACRPTPAARDSLEVDLARLLPDAISLAGLAMVEPPATFLPDTLFEPLDGGATVYVDYGFVRLCRVEYRLGSAPRSRIVLDVFDMGSPLGAFGIYRSSAPDGATVQSWGAEGCRFGTVATTWKGRVFVHAEADAETPPLVEALELLVAEVGRLAPGTPEMPDELRLLPTPGLLPRSERFVARELLGHAFLPGGFVASYDLKGGRVEAFFADLRRGRAARQALAHLRDAYASPDEGTGVADSTIRFSTPTGDTGIATQVARFIAGVYGAAPEAQLKELLSRLVDNLESAESTSADRP